MGVLPRFCPSCGGNVIDRGLFVACRCRQPDKSAKEDAPVETRMEKWSGFVLDDNGSWTQPVFKVPAGTPEPAIQRAFERAYQYEGFYFCGLQRDDDCPNDDLPVLEVETVTSDFAPSAEERLAAAEQLLRRALGDYRSSGWGMRADLAADMRKFLKGAQR